MDVANVNNVVTEMKEYLNEVYILYQQVTFAAESTEYFGGGAVSKVFMLKENSLSVVSVIGMST